MHHLSFIILPETGVKDNITEDMEQADLSIRKGTLSLHKLAV